MLEQQRILIIGGGSGIGLALAIKAAQEGALVAVASRRARARLAQAPLPQGVTIQAHDFDIGDPAQLAPLLALAGPLDHLVIAVRPPLEAAPLPQVDPDQAQEAFAVKFWGAYRLLQLAPSHINSGGSVILTSGIAGQKLYPGASTMALVNNAVEGLVRVAALELAPLRVNGVSPGFMAPKTPAVEEMARGFPLGRLGALEEIVEAYLFLMNNPYATGSVTVVDGGARLL